MRRGVAIKKAPVQTKLPVTFSKPKRIGTRNVPNPTIEHQNHLRNT